ncbi:MAG: MASE3 domain-containing protein [bacterium]|nr:MASE3 domain-containing protein [bacterium]
MNPPDFSSNRSLWGTWLISLLMLALATAVSWADFLIFHSLVETFSVLVSFCVFVLAWHTRDLVKFDFLLFLGIGYLFSGLLDMIHTLIFPGMSTWTELGGLNPTVQVWIAARGIQAFTLAAAPLFVIYRVRPYWTFFLFALVSGLLLEGILGSGWFPTCWVSGQGLTPFKIYVEYLIAAVMLLGGLGLWRFRQSFPPNTFRLMAAAIVATALSELALTVYQTASDLPNLIGHLLKLLAVLLVFRAVVAEGLRNPFGLLFHQLQASSLETEKHRDQLKSLLDQQSRELELSDEELHKRIEEQTRTQQALYQQRALTETVLDALPINVFLKDAEGRFLMTSEQTAKTFGRSKDELVGLTDLDLFPGEIARANQEEDKLILSGQGPLNHERELIFQGQTKFILTGKRLIKLPETEDLMVLGFGLDISDRKEMENQLIQAKERAEAASQAKSNFLAIMSHELRTPLNGMLGMSQLMLYEEEDTERREQLKIILSSGNGLLTILSDILDINRIEQHSLAAELAEFNLLDLCNNLSMLFRASAEVKGLSFLFEPPPAELGRLMGDAPRVNQILSNLLGNAIKFTHQGQVSLKVRQEPSENDQVALLFEVEDTGIGIPLDRQEKIFDAFTQIDSSSTRRFGGTGLGLSLAQRLVHILGGTMGLESEPGVGSRFWVRLQFDLADPDQPTPTITEDLSAQPHSTEVKAPKQRRVLIAEDDRVNQIVLEKMVKTYGAHPVIAGNGAEALDRFAKDRFDLILMD